MVAEARATFTLLLSLGSSGLSLFPHMISLGILRACWSFSNQPASLVTNFVQHVYSEKLHVEVSNPLWPSPRSHLLSSVFVKAVTRLDNLLLGLQELEMEIPPHNGGMSWTFKDDHLRWQWSPQYQVTSDTCYMTSLMVGAGEKYWINQALVEIEI